MTFKVSSNASDAPPYVGSTEHSQILANGNQLADLGSYVKTDGSVATLGEVTLPDMQGAGQVRSLREVASISTTLAGLLSQFASAGRADQQALLDQILDAWSDTSTMVITFGGYYQPVERYSGFAAT